MAHTPRFTRTNRTTNDAGAAVEDESGEQVERLDSEKISSDVFFVAGVEKPSPALSNHGRGDGETARLRRVQDGMGGCQTNPPTAYTTTVCPQYGVDRCVTHHASTPVWGSSIKEVDSR
ncbi:hypothetical protein SAMN05421858_5128 [Haladaptatus litoreus]|uniref:Uncharacterized protein n=1 Tax=Haladaptatus litoreus TaxID=553468 RepID=A0A1N7FK64_9EURY|nr:hypothetical protein SAMN05421858_5128 [Haladaptatus litoreus]